MLEKSHLLGVELIFVLNAGIGDIADGKDDDGGIAVVVVSAGDGSVLDQFIDRREIRGSRRSRLGGAFRRLLLIEGTNGRIRHIAGATETGINVGRQMDGTCGAVATALGTALRSIRSIAKQGDPGRLASRTRRQRKGVSFVFQKDHALFGNLLVDGKSCFHSLLLGRIVRRIGLIGEKPFCGYINPPSHRCLSRCQASKRENRSRRKGEERTGRNSAFSSHDDLL